MKKQDFDSLPLQISDHFVLPPFDFQSLTEHKLATFTAIALYKAYTHYFISQSLN